MILTMLIRWNKAAFKGYLRVKQPHHCWAVSQSHIPFTVFLKKHFGTVCVRTFLQTCRRCRSPGSDTRSSLRHFNPFFSLFFFFFKDPLKQHWLFPRMTFCRHGNDYADVAQPFRLTGGSHGDAVTRWMWPRRQATDTSPLLRPARPFCLCLVWPFPAWWSSCYLQHILKQQNHQSDQTEFKNIFIWCLNIFLFPMKILKCRIIFFGSSEAGLFHWNQGKIWDYLSPSSCYLINRFSKENVTCAVNPPPACRCLPAPPSNDSRDPFILPADWPPAIPLTADLLHHISTFLLLLLQIIFPFILSFLHPLSPRAPSALLPDCIWQEIFQAMRRGCRSHAVADAIDRRHLHT